MTPEEKFWDAVEKTDDCWLWTKGTSHGYGTFIANGSTLRAHRYSYELHKGPIPAGMEVRHTCDNPSCVNPAHLLVGTHAQNMADMKKRGRAGKQPGAQKTGLIIRFDRKKIYHLMLDNGIESQAELAGLMGVSNTAVSKWLNGDTFTSGSLGKFCEALGVMPDDVLECIPTAPANASTEVTR